GDRPGPDQVGAAGRGAELLDRHRQAVTEPVDRGGSHHATSLHVWRLTILWTADWEMPYSMARLSWVASPAAYRDRISRTCSSVIFRWCPAGARRSGLSGWPPAARRMFARARRTSK